MSGPEDVSEYPVDLQDVARRFAKFSNGQLCYLILVVAPWMEGNGWPFLSDRGVVRLFGADWPIRYQGKDN